MVNDADGKIDQEAGSPASGARLSDWLWRPWYAKIWWAAIPLYWLTITAPFRTAFLNEYLRSSFAGYMHAVFTPITATAVLGFGFLRRALKKGQLEPYEMIGRRVVETDPDSPYAVHRWHDQ